MKIEKTRTRSPGWAIQKERSSQGRPLTFSDTINNLAVEKEQRLEAIGQELDEQAKRFAKSPTMEELMKYKEMIASFVAEAVRRMYQMVQTTGWQGTGRHRIYTVAQKIDEALEELTETILKGQVNQIALLAKLDEIRGMVLDLYS
jgi:uncharacterized protein YaaR (DUF327 family)